MKNFTVRDHMTSDFVAVTADTDIRRAVSILLSNDISGVPVVDNTGTLVGFLTERDCIEVALHASYHDEQAGPVTKYMSTDIKTVSPEANLMDVAEMCVASPFRRFPVVDEGRLVGIISRRDILHALNRGTWFRHD